MPRLAALILVLFAVSAVPASPAHAVPPLNDAPAAAAPFEPYVAEAGLPVDQQAVAELAEATADPGVAPCLGAGSFARTVWYRIAGAPTAREITVEASGRTLELVDLAAYVQDAPEPRTDRANVCAGAGAGGAAAGEDRTSAITLRVPPGYGVLLQVGRRAAAGSPDDQRAVLALTETPLEASAGPRGDRAGLATPSIPRASGSTLVPLAGATTTAEDPAVPACPSLGGVWRRFTPRERGRLTFTATGAEVGALSVFAGERPRAVGFAGCIDREGAGPLVLPVTARRGRPLWIRLGTDRPPADATARLTVRRAVPSDVADGGACLGTPDARIGGVLPGRPVARARNRDRLLVLRLTVARGPVCAARLALDGPRGRVYARAEVAVVRGRGQLVTLQRVRRLVRGRYRLRAEGTGLAGVRGRVPTTVSIRLR